MLRHAADIRTLIYMAVTTALLIVQEHRGPSDELVILGIFSKNARGSSMRLERLGRESEESIAGPADLSPSEATAGV